MTTTTTQATRKTSTKGGTAEDTGATAMTIIARNRESERLEGELKAWYAEAIRKHADGQASEAELRALKIVARKYGFSIDTDADVIRKIERQRRYFDGKPESDWATMASEATEAHYAAVAQWRDLERDCRERIHAKRQEWEELSRIATCRRSAPREVKRLQSQSPHLFPEASDGTS